MKIKNGFFESIAVQVFPCAYRGDNGDTTANKVIFDPEAKLNTEANFVKSASGVSGFAKSYISSWDANKLTCIIAGYTFTINVSIADIHQAFPFTQNTYKSMYLRIGVAPRPILSSSHPTEILSNLILDGSHENLDNHITDAQAAEPDDTFYFTGLQLITEDDLNEAFNVGNGVKVYALKILRPNTNNNGWEIENTNYLPKIMSGRAANSVNLNQAVKNPDSLNSHTSNEGSIDTASTYATTINKGQISFAPNALAVNNATINGTIEAKADNAFAANWGIATAPSSTAFGHSTAAGEDAFAAGEEATAKANNSCAIGMSQANSYNSVAINSGNTGSADDQTGLTARDSFAANNSTALHSSSATFGTGTVSTASNQTVVGAYNEQTRLSDLVPAFIVGNGVSSGKGASDAFRVYAKNPDNAMYSIDQESIITKAVYSEGIDLSIDDSVSEHTYLNWQCDGVPAELNIKPLAVSADSLNTCIDNDVERAANNTLLAGENNILQAKGLKNSIIVGNDNTVYGNPKGVLQKNLYYFGNFLNNETFGRKGTSALTTNGMIVGKYNAPLYYSTLFAVGHGTSASSKNIFTIATTSDNLGLLNTNKIVLADQLEYFNIANNTIVYDSSYLGSQLVKKIQTSIGTILYVGTIATITFLPDLITKPCYKYAVLAEDGSATQQYVYCQYRDKENIENYTGEAPLIFFTQKAGNDLMPDESRPIVFQGVESYTPFTQLTADKIYTPYLKASGADIATIEANNIKTSEMASKNITCTKLTADGVKTAALSVDSIFDLNTSDPYYTYKTSDAIAIPLIGGKAGPEEYEHFKQRVINIYNNGGVFLVFLIDNSGEGNLANLASLGTICYYVPLSGEGPDKVQLFTSSASILTSSTKGLIYYRLIIDTKTKDIRLVTANNAAASNFNGTVLLHKIGPTVLQEII